MSHFASLLEIKGVDCFIFCLSVCVACSALTIALETSLYTKHFKNANLLICIFSGYRLMVKIKIMENFLLFFFFIKISNLKLSGIGVKIRQLNCHL